MNATASDYANPAIKTDAFANLITGLVNREIAIREAARPIDHKTAEAKRNGFADAVAATFGWTAWFYAFAAQQAVTATYVEFGELPLPGDKKRRAFVEAAAARTAIHLTENWS